MRVIVFVKATAESETGAMPPPELFEAMTQYNEALVAAGIMQGGEGLHPSSNGKRIAFDGTNRAVIDGPFSEVSELVAGFWLWKVKDMDEAVEWAKRCPNPMSGPSELEIRRIYEAEDFGDAMTPDIAAREEKMRGQVEGK